MAMAYGMGYVPKDKDRQALMVSDSIENNVALSMLDELKGLHLDLYHRQK